MQFSQLLFLCISTIYRLHVIDFIGADFAIGRNRKPNFAIV